MAAQLLQKNLLLHIFVIVAIKNNCDVTTPLHINLWDRISISQRGVYRIINIDSFKIPIH